MALADKMVTVEDLKAVYDKYKTGLEVWQDVTGLTWDYGPYIEQGSSTPAIISSKTSYLATMARVSVSQGQEYEMYHVGHDVAHYYSPDGITYLEYPAVLSKASTLSNRSDNIYCDFGNGGVASSNDTTYKTEIIIPAGYPYMFVFNYTTQISGGSNIPVIIRKRIR